MASTPRTRRAARTAAALLVAAATAPLTAGLAQASTTTQGTAPSSCRPANHRGVVTTDEPSAGHVHYRVTLTAAPGYAPCVLAGTPSDLIFRLGDGPVGVTAAPSGQSGAPVTFGPGQPVHFDIQVRNTPGRAPADAVTFALPGIPGDSVAGGGMAVDAGTQVGPLQPGA
jgi:hypothetical protein